MLCFDPVARHDVMSLLCTRRYLMFDLTHAFIPHLTLNPLNELLLFITPLLDVSIHNLHVHACTVYIDILLDVSVYNLHVHACTVYIECSAMYRYSVHVHVQHCFLCLVYIHGYNTIDILTCIVPTECR